MANKRPIETKATELRCYCIVMFTDEFRTSKFCIDNKTTELEHPIIERSKTKIIKIYGKKEIIFNYI